MIELIAGEGDQATIGVAGDAYNTAVYMTKLTHQNEVSVSFVTALGVDQFSGRILSAMAEHGINHSYVERRNDQMPGLYAIETDENGERSFSYWRSNSAAKTLFAEPCSVQMSRLADFDILYISGITMAILPADMRTRLIKFLTEYRKGGGKLAFDSNFRPRLWEDLQTAREVIMRMWSLTDIALPSIDDETALFGESNETDVLKRLNAAGVRFGALKRGGLGPMLIGTSDAPACSFDKINNVVDSTAAGDSFNAGFLSEYIRGATIDEAARKGHEVASRVIQKKGAIVARNCDATGES